MDFTAEHWLPIAGYEGFYEVSDQGQVRSLSRVDAAGRKRRGKVLRPHVTGCGHYAVLLYRDGVREAKKIHRLVLETFIGPCPAGCETLHYNDIKTDNRLGNLRWGTHKENFQDAIRNGVLPHVGRSCCAKGHPYTPESTYVTPKGIRVCRICRREVERRYAATHKHQHAEKQRRRRARLRASRDVGQID